MTRVAVGYTTRNRLSTVDRDELDKLPWKGAGRADHCTLRAQARAGRGEILHAYRNPVRVWDLGDGFTMIVGPNQAAIFLEVGYVDGEQAHVIVHAMLAREKFLR